jgi:hypothetical protein
MGARPNHVTVSFPMVRNEGDCIRYIPARQGTKAPQRTNRGSECVRTKRCKPAGLCRSDTVDLHPHWRQQNRDAVCTPIRPLPSAERSPQTLAFEAFTHGNTCLAAGQFADATAAFEQARAGSETALCGRAAGRSRTAATCRQRPGAHRGRRVVVWPHACGHRGGSAGASHGRGHLTG